MAKCRDCGFREENYMGSIQGQGVYRFSYCAEKIYDCQIVDPDCERDCDAFKEAECKTDMGSITK